MENHIRSQRIFITFNQQLHEQHGLTGTLKGNIRDQLKLISFALLGNYKHKDMQGILN